MKSKRIFLTVVFSVIFAMMLLCGSAFAVTASRTKKLTREEYYEIYGQYPDDDYYLDDDDDYDDYDSFSDFEDSSDDDLEIMLDEDYDDIGYDDYAQSDLDEIEYELEMNDETWDETEKEYGDIDGKVVDFFQVFDAEDNAGEGTIETWIDEVDYEDDSDLFEDEMIVYFYFDDPLWFEDNDIDPDPVQFPDELAGQLVNWSYDTRNYPYKARVRTRGGRLNIRSGPTTGARVTGRLQNGEIVIVMARSNDLNWAYIVASDGKQGFVFDSYLTTNGLRSQKSQAAVQKKRISFMAADLDGNEYSSEEIFGQHRAVMINNWATWCPNCTGELEELESISEWLAGYNCAIIGVVRDAMDEDTIRQARDLLKEHGVTYLNLLPCDDADDILPLDAYPTSYFVDSNGTLLGEKIEGADIEGYIYRFYDILN